MTQEQLDKAVRINESRGALQKLTDCFDYGDIERISFVTDDASSVYLKDFKDISSIIKEALIQYKDGLDEKFARL